MKNLLSGFLCVGLALSGAAAAGRAQEAVPNSQAPQQTPPPPPPPPPSETPAPQEPESQTGIKKLTIPALPRVPDVQMPGEKGISIGIGAWPTGSQMEILKGKAASSSYPGDLTLHSNRKIGSAFDFTVAAGKHNQVHLSYFKANGPGDTTAPEDMTIWTANYNKGTLLSTNYRLQSFKASFEYLTWPYPVKTSRFRLRSLWSIQYTGVRSSFDAPLLPTVDVNGNPITDASGNPVTYATQGSHWFILPEVGLSAQEYISRTLNVEFSASGFTIPHHQNTWSADGSVNVRLGHYELRLGAKAYHFRSSPQADYWMRGTVYGPMVALRWHSDEVKP